MNVIKICKICKRIQGIVNEDPMQCLWLDFRLGRSYDEHTKRHNKDYSIVDHTDLKC